MNTNEYWLIANRTIPTQWYIGLCQIPIMNFTRRKVVWHDIMDEGLRFSSKYDAEAMLRIIMDLEPSKEPPPYIKHVPKKILTIQEIANLMEKRMSEYQSSVYNQTSYTLGQIDTLREYSHLLKETLSKT